jgi:outer membrane protein
VKRLPFLLLALALVGAIRADEPGSAPLLTLADAQALALRNHPRLAAAQIQAMIAEESVRQARAGFFPTVNAYVSGVDAGNENTRILAGGINNPSVYDRVAGGLGASELITDFGHTANLTAGAKLEARAEVQNAAATRAQILLNVNVAYFAALQAQAVRQVADEALRARQFLVDQVSALAAHKLRSELDVSFAQVALEEVRLLQQKAEGDAEAAQAALAAALGYGHGTDPDGGAGPSRWQPVEPPPAPPPPDAESAITAGLRDRPDLLRLRDEATAAEKFSRAESDSNYPTIALVGTAGDAVHYDIHLPQHYAAGGVLLNVPLFTGGLASARQHAAAYKAQIADENVREAEDNASRDVRVAWLNLRTAGQRLLTMRQLLRHAVQADQLAQARYRVGSSSIVELSEAQLNRTSAEIAQASARYDVLTARSILDYQMGALR